MKLLTKPITETLIADLAKIGYTSAHSLKLKAFSCFAQTDQPQRDHPQPRYSL